jgi:hypothetical protein
MQTTTGIVQITKTMQSTTTTQITKTTQITTRNAREHCEGAKG